MISEFKDLAKVNHNAMSLYSLVSSISVTKCIGSADMNSNRRMRWSESLARVYTESHIRVQQWQTSRIIAGLFCLKFINYYQCARTDLAGLCLCNVWQHKLNIYL